MSILLIKNIIRASYTIRNFHVYNFPLNTYDILQSVRSDFYKGNPKLTSFQETPNVRKQNKFSGRIESRKIANKSKPKKYIVNWKTGSERARLAANRIIKEVYELNKDGCIKTVDIQTNQVQDSNIRNFIKGLDLDEQGLSIVNIEKVQSNNNTIIQIPLLKKVDVKTALKKYTEQLARKKEKELADLGVLKKKSTSSKKDSTIKHIRITWQISKDDLCNQKANEITALLKKGHKVNLYIESRSNNLSKNWLENFEELENSTYRQNLSKREIREYNEVIDILKDIVEPYSINPVIVGSIYNKVIMKLVPKPETKNIIDKKALREERKKQRQLKLQKRIEKKKLKEHELM